MAAPEPTNTPSEATTAPAAPSRSTLEADLTKYKVAADIVHATIKKLIPKLVEGAKIFDLCVEGDKLIEEGCGAVYNKSVKGVKVVKGIAFPTSISVNNVCSHFSPLLSDPLSEGTLNKGDVVKIHLGAHIDGFASVSAETMVVGANASNPVQGRHADAIAAAYAASQIAMRLVKKGNKNWAITDAVGKAVSGFNCHPVEGMLSCQQSQHVIDGKKRIILNPSEAARREFETAVFADGEVYGIDILVSSAEDGKARTEDSRTTIYQRISETTYQLKMKTSRAVFSEVQKKAGAFPFTVRILEDEKRARMGLQEAVQRNLVRPYDVLYTPTNTVVAAFHFTIALLPAGPTLISQPPVWYSPDVVKPDGEVKDEELKALLEKPLREDKKAKKKAVAEAAKEESQ